MYKYPERVIFGVKHLIGHKYHDCSVQELLENVGFKIQPDVNDNPLIVVDGKKYMPEEILGFLLEHVKYTYKNYTCQEATDCVITVPAYFNDAQNSCKNRQLKYPQVPQRTNSCRHRLQQHLTKG